MKRVFLATIPMMAMLMATGCAPKSTVPDERITDTSLQQKAAEPEAPAPVAEAPKEEAKPAEPVMTEEIKPDEIASVKPMEEPVEVQMAKELGVAPERLAVVVSQEGETRAFTDVNFDFDKYNIKYEYHTTLYDLATWLINNEAIALLEGHCDERGTNEYNLALGDRRSVSVKDFLLANGVPHRKIETISYGEERPLCQDQDEDCWAKNRRAHFVIGTTR